MQIFSPIMWLSFHFVVSFAVQKLSSLIRSHLFILHLFSLLWKLDQNLCQSVLPMFSSKSFIISVLHFEFIFVYSTRERSNFTLLHVAIQFSQHHLSKRLSSSIVYSCLLCCRLIDYRWEGLFLGFLSYSIDLYFCFCASTILFWWL